MVGILLPSKVSPHWPFSGARPKWLWQVPWYGRENLSALPSLPDRQLGAVYISDFKAFWGPAFFSSLPCCVQATWDRDIVEEGSPDSFPWCHCSCTRKSLCCLPHTFQGQGGSEVCLSHNHPSGPSSPLGVFCFPWPLCSVLRASQISLGSVVPPFLWTPTLLFPASFLPLDEGTFPMCADFPCVLSTPILSGPGLLKLRLFLHVLRNLPSLSH